LAQEAEALRIIAEAALALISVTVPTYAISASFLGKETARTMRQIQQKRQETERRIASEAKNIEEMYAAIRRYTLEEQNLRGRLKRISLQGVVAYPAVFYGIALIVASAGIYEYPNPVILSPGASPIPTLPISLGGIVIGSILLGTALQAIERVAKEIEAIPTESKIEAPVTPAIETRRVAAYYFVDALETGKLGVKAVGVQKVVVDWQRKVAYWFDDRIDKAVRQGKIPAFAIPSLNEDEWCDKGKLALVKRAPRPEELTF
jgi:ABC-type multidrug transport system fused ATPase/permease subunit